MKRTFRIKRGHTDLPPSVKKVARHQLRRAAIKRQDNLCFWCGVKMTPPRQQGDVAPRSATLDHVKASALGGKDTTRNTVAACWKCNQERGMSPSLLRRTRDNGRERRERRLRLWRLLQVPRRQAEPLRPPLFGDERPDDPVPYVRQQALPARDGPSPRLHPQQRAGATWQPLLKD